MHSFEHAHLIFLNPVLDLGSQSIWPEFWGGFSGAFFAFAFGFITYIITRRRERFVLHKTTLVRLDRILMTNLHKFGVLETVVKDASNSMQQMHTTSNRLSTFDIPTDIEMDLGSIDLINKIFSYRMSLERLNFNVQSINHTLTRIEDLYINGQPVVPVNYIALKAKLDHLLQHDLAQLNEWTKKLLVLERIHQRKLSTKSAFIEAIFRTQWEQDISAEEKAEEYTKLESEINDAQASSPDEIF